MSEGAIPVLMVPFDSLEPAEGLAQGIRLVRFRARPWLAMSEGAKRPSRMVEAAGVEPASESTPS